MAAMEEGIFPTIRSLDSGDGIEEERRLCYVGITRAKERLILTRADSRRTFGSINMQMPSRFLRDLPPDTLELVEDSRPRYSASSFGGSSYSPKWMKRPVETPNYEDESQQSPEDDSASDFRRGQKVRHASFGEGVIKSVERVGSDECLTIEFRQKGRKRVLSQYVQAITVDDFV
jgi:DNA helicase-2/ATP-dependent DNA helicase PcrA